MVRFRTGVLLCVLPCLPSVAGCRSEPVVRKAAAVRVDSTNQRALDGLSDEQIRERARPMSPEQAARRGIEDTLLPARSEP